MNKEVSPARRDALLRSCTVWDNHACLPLRADATFMPQLRRYRDAGVNLVSINVGFGEMSWPEHLAMLQFFRSWIESNSTEYSLISSVGDIDRARLEGKLGIVFDVEGMRPLATEPQLVQTCYDLGVRWMLVAYNTNNLAGGGCLDKDTGLTANGRAIIDAMETAGMVLCVSHTGARTAHEAVEYSRNPVILSHSNPAADTPHARNVSDTLMRAVARTGGVVGLSGIGPYLGVGANLVGNLLRQLQYAIDVVGSQHVGLGLDYVFDRSELDEYVRQNPQMFPAELGIGGGMPMVAPEDFSAIVDGLIRIGLGDHDIRGVLGNNWLRVARHVWRS